MKRLCALEPWKQCEPITSLKVQKQIEIQTYAFILSLIALLQLTQ